MSTPDANTANSESTTVNTADVTAATNTFINDATTLIANAISLGQFSITLNAFYPADLAQISTHFQNLGYVIFIPQLQNLQPSYNDFGYNWQDYWELHVNPPNAVVLILNSSVQVQIDWDMA